MSHRRRHCCCRRPEFFCPICHPTNKFLPLFRRTPQPPFCRRRHCLRPPRRAVMVSKLNKSCPSFQVARHKFINWLVY